MNDKWLRNTDTGHKDLRCNFGGHGHGGGDQKIYTKVNADHAVVLKKKMKTYTMYPPGIWLYFESYSLGCCGWNEKGTESKLRCWGNPAGIERNWDGKMGSLNRCCWRSSRNCWTSWGCGWKRNCCGCNWNCWGWNCGLCCWNGWKGRNDWGMSSTGIKVGRGSGRTGCGASSAAVKTAAGRVGRGVVRGGLVVTTGLSSFGRGLSGIPSWSASTLFQSSSVPNSSSSPMFPPLFDGRGSAGKCWPLGAKPCALPDSYATALTSPNSSMYLFQSKF